MESDPQGLKEKKQNFFCFPTLKPKGLLRSSVMALCWIYIKKVFSEKCFLC